MPLFHKIYNNYKKGILLKKITERIKLLAYDSKNIPIGDDYYGDRANIYDSHREKDPYWIAEDDFVKEFLVNNQDLNNVLDAPFGTGRFLNHYIQNNLDVIALDSSKDMISQAEKKYKNLMQNVKVLVQKIEKIPYDTNSIDLVVCFRFLPWIVSFREAEKSLQELSRVCGKYALLELCVGKHNNPSTEIKKNQVLLDKFNEKEITDWLLKFNFKVKESFLLHDDDLHPGLTAFVCEKISKI